MYGCGPDTNWQWNNMEKLVQPQCLSKYEVLKSLLIAWFLFLRNRRLQLHPQWSSEASREIILNRQLVISVYLHLYLKPFFQCFGFLDGVKQIQFSIKLARKEKVSKTSQSYNLGLRLRHGHKSVVYL